MIGMHFNKTICNELHLYVVIFVTFDVFQLLVYR